MTFDPCGHLVKTSNKFSSGAHKRKLLGEKKLLKKDSTAEAFFKPNERQRESTVAER